MGAYDDATGAPIHEGEVAKGKLTIGYGHTGADVKPGMRITPEEGLALLGKDCEWAEDSVNSHVTIPINQNEFDALVCFTFNCGVGAFQGSGLLKCLNANNREGAVAEFAKWNHASGKVLAGLTRRRADEVALFKTPVKE